MSTFPSSEQSLWRTFYPAVPAYPKLTGNITVDVAVVGAGITGLTTAYLLKNAGLTVAVVEKHTVGGGTTGRTTGKVTSQHNLMYADMEKRFDQKVTKMYGEANETAIREIERIISKEQISCDWERDDNYVFTADTKRLEEFKKEADAAVRAGLPASFETTSPLPFEIKAAVKFENQAKINTQKYLLGLAAAVQGGGSYTFENSNVIGIREGNPGRIKTAKGKVHAKHIVVASSVPTLPLAARGAYAVHEYPSESYIVAGAPDVELSGMYISPDKEHYSILPITIDGEDMLLVGGEGHFWGLRGNRHARFMRLANYADQHFGVRTIERMWSDRDYLPYDGIPLVGRLYPWSKRLYVATAFKKWGLSNGTAAAMILRDHITGSANPWAKIYDTQRPTILNRLTS